MKFKKQIIVVTSTLIGLLFINRYTTLATVLLILLGVVLVGSYFSFRIPSHPELVSLTHSTTTKMEHRCYHSDTSVKPIDDNGVLDVLVWNIHKEKDKGWQTELDTFALNAGLIMLQEASITSEFKEWVKTKSWGANYVNAFEMFDVSAGVLNLARSMPKEACAYISVEPWVLLPKSALYATYLLSNGQTLAVVNIHAINFTFGIKEYVEQIKVIRETVSKHKGPLMITGDFNTWRQGRLDRLIQATRDLDLVEAQFSPDHRKQFLNGMALDHLFYRGLDFVSAKSVKTNASDHSPLQARFHLK